MTSDEWRVIRGLGRKRRHPPVWLRWVMGGVCVVVGALVWNQVPRASALPDVPAPIAAKAAVVVEGASLRVVDARAAAEIFDVAPVEAIPIAAEPDDDVLLPGEPGNFVVPSVAVVSRHGHAFVLVARDNDRIDPVSVTLVSTRDGRSQIAGALTAADHVVAGGAIYLLNMLVLQGGL